MKKPGRPSLYTPVLADEVVSHITARRCSELKNASKVYVHEAGGYRNRSGRRADVLAAV
jgi:hypothetical protein